MAELTLNEKFQKLTGISVLDIEKYINEAENKNEAFAKLQWRIPRGRYTDPSLVRDDNESLAEKTKLFAEVIKEIADNTGIDMDSVDLNENGNEDFEDKIAKSSLSEATAILAGYNSEDEEDNSSN